MLRKVVMGTGLVALVPVVSAATPVKNDPDTPVRPPPMRPSDLPMYDAPHAEYGEYVWFRTQPSCYVI